MTDIPDISLSLEGTAKKKNLYLNSTNMLTPLNIKTILNASAVLLNTLEKGGQLALSQRWLICRESFGFQMDLETVTWVTVLLSDQTPAFFLLCFLSIFHLYKMILGAVI